MWAICIKTRDSSPSFVSEGKIVRLGVRLLGLKHTRKIKKLSRGSGRCGCPENSASSPGVPLWFLIIINEALKDDKVDCLLREVASSRMFPALQ